jgi:hypothetical protein
MNQQPLTLRSLIDTYVFKPSITEKGMFITEIKHEISCHKCNLESILVNCIYRKIHKKAKRTIYSKLFTLFEKMISYKFFGYKICGIFEDRKLRSTRTTSLDFASSK